jgi:hypothetical protein
MANSDVLIGWLKEAGAHAFELEGWGRLLVDVLVTGGTVGVRVRSRSAGRNEQAFDCITWSELERTETKANPLLPLIDEVIADIGKR